MAKNLNAMKAAMVLARPVRPIAEVRLMVARDRKADWRLEHARTK